MGGNVRSKFKKVLRNSTALQSYGQQCWVACHLHKVKQHLIIAVLLNALERTLVSSASNQPQLI